MFSVFITESNAQYTQIGDGLFRSGNLGPIATDTLPAFYSRFAYIYPEASLTNLQNNDTIFALGFDHFSFDSLRGNTNIKIYIKPTSASDFGVGNINWLAETRSGMTLVYEGDGKDVIGLGPKKAVFVFNEVVGYKWENTGARNLQILVEYTQTTNQVERFPWYMETSASVPAFASNNEVKYIFGSSTSGLDSITNRSSRTKPTLRIYHPSAAQDLEVTRMYSLGRVPLLMKRPDSVKVVIENVGKEPLLATKVYLDVAGANTFSDSITISVLNPYQSQMVYFDTYEPTRLGTEVLMVSAEPDDVSTNDRISKNRRVTYSEYSHTDPFLGNTGGIGFNNSTGDFLAKFYVQGSSFINQIKLDFNILGQPFQLGVWEENAEGLPGNQIFLSDTVVSNGSTFIQPVLPRVQVTGGYYVGIRQTSGNNVGFSYQDESPIRPNTFYFAAPAESTDWVGFSPGFDFNFNIQPRLQVANDIGIVRMLEPAEQDSIEYSLTDSLTPQVTLYNFGFRDQAGFITRLRVTNRFNQEIYRNDQPTSVLSGDSVTIAFEKLSKFNLGEFTAEASIILNTDSVTDNNSLENTFFMIKKYDVGVNLIFAPSAGDTVVLNRGIIAPVVRLSNYGTIAQNNVPVIAEVVNNRNEVIARTVKLVNLAASTTLIQNLDEMNVPEIGRMKFRVYTQATIDSFRVNDTAQFTIISVKVNDIALRTLQEPAANELFAKGAMLSPFIVYFNEGRVNEDSVAIVGTIRGLDGSTLYADTVYKSAPRFSNGQTVLRDWRMDSIGDFTFEARSILATDQVAENDSILHSFSVITSNDLQLKELLRPAATIISQGSSTITPELVVANRGLDDLNDIPVYMRIINNANDTVYKDTIRISSTSISLDTVAFKSLFFNSIGDFTVEIRNGNPGESNRSANDTLNSTYRVRYANDLQLIAVEQPEVNEFIFQDSSVLPIVNVQNLGVDTIKDRRVDMEVRDESNNVVWFDQVTISSLPYPQTQKLTATKSWLAEQKGNYTARFFTAVDDDPTNNEISVPFRVGNRRDAAALSIDLPKLDEDLVKTYSYKPQVRVANIGKDDLIDMEVKLTVEVSGAQIYEDTRNISIARSAERIVEMDSSLSYPNLANAVAILVVNALDDNTLNDTLITSFRFVKGLGARSIQAAGIRVYPIPFSHIIHIDTDQKILDAQLHSLTGQLVWKSSSITNKSLLIGQGVAVGTYILTLTTAEGIQQVQVMKK